MKVSLEEREALFHQLVAERDALLDKARAVMAERDTLTIKEAKKAKAMAQEATRIQAQASKMTPEIRAARYEMERAERHYMWETAVFNLWGEQGLQDCRQQMRQEKILRDARAAYK